MSNAVPVEMKSAGQQGAHVVLEDIYRRHFMEMCAAIRKAFGPGPPDPEDVVQAAFLKYAGLKDPKGVQNPRAFLYKTARNIVLDHKKKKKTIEAHIAEVLGDDTDDLLEQITPERVLVEKDRFERMIDVTRRLPHKQRTILRMSRVEGKSYAEIHATTGWSMGDISRQMNAALEALAVAVEAGEDPTGLGS